MVAQRRHLPGLRPQLRRRQWRRHRRPGGVRARLRLRPRPRGRRHLAQPLLPVAAGRRRLRRRRLPRRRSAASGPWPTSTPCRRGPRARAPGDRRPRAQPHLGPAPLVPGRARRATRQPRAGPLLVPRRSGCGGDEPPNNWSSNFGGGAWTRVTEADGRRPVVPAPVRPEQPDLNWTNPEVREEFESILRFWLDRGVDGFRIDVAHGLAKDPDMPDLGGRLGAPAARPASGHPHWDRDEVHEMYRAWRRRRPTRTRASGPSSARCGWPPRRGWPATCGPTSCTPPSTSTSCSPVGRRGDADAIDDSIARARRGRRAAHLGAVQPRRRPGT